MSRKFVPSNLSSKGRDLYSLPIHPYGGLNPSISDSPFSMIPILHPLKPDTFLYEKGCDYSQYTIPYDSFSKLVLLSSDIHMMANDGSRASRVLLQFLSKVSSVSFDRGVVLSDLVEDALQELYEVDDFLYVMEIMRSLFAAMNLTTNDMNILVDLLVVRADREMAAHATGFICQLGVDEMARIVDLREDTLVLLQRLYYYDFHRCFYYSTPVEFFLSPIRDFGIYTDFNAVDMSLYYNVMFSTEQHIVSVMDVLLSLDLPESPVISIVDQGSIQLSEIIPIILPGATLHLTGESYRSWHAELLDCVTYVDSEEDLPVSDVIISCSVSYGRNKSDLDCRHTHEIYPVVYRSPNGNYRPIIKRNYGSCYLKYPIVTARFDHIGDCNDVFLRHYESNGSHYSLEQRRIIACVLCRVLTIQVSEVDVADLSGNCLTIHSKDFNDDIRRDLCLGCNLCSDSRFSVFELSKYAGSPYRCFRCGRSSAFVYPSYSLPRRDAIPMGFHRIIRSEESKRCYNPLFYSHAEYHVPPLGPISPKMFPTDRKYRICSGSGFGLCKSHAFYSPLCSYAYMVSGGECGTSLPPARGIPLPVDVFAECPRCMNILNEQFKDVVLTPESDNSYYVGFHIPYFI